jgi:putative transposase
MPGFGLRKNLVFEWNGTCHRIDRVQPNGEILLERTEDGVLSIAGQDVLLRAYSAGEIKAFPAYTNGRDGGVPTFSRPLDELSDAIQNEVARRRHYLQTILSLENVVFTKRRLQPIILEAAEQISDPHPPSTITLWRWYRRYRATRDGRALIPRIDRRGSSMLKQSGRVLQLASDAIEEAFSFSPQATCVSIHTRLLAKIDAENRQLPTTAQHKRPALRTMYRMLGRVEAYQQAAFREGKAAADKKYRLVKASTRTTHILERVEIDHTPLDLFLVDDKTGLPLGRPTLTVVIDHFSRMLLGYYLSYAAPSLAAVMGALRHAILPKPPVAEVIPKLRVEHAWPCYGRPDRMVVDNGLEFHSKALEEVALDLGSHLLFCPKFEPRFKGAVERYLGTINRFLSHQLPGTSLARLHERGDYDPQKHALFTLAEFNHIFQKWVLDVYAQTIHRGVHETPWCRWHDGLKHRSPELPESVHALQRRIGQIEERALRHDGILLHGIRYNSAALAPILCAYGIGTKVRILYDHEDLGTVYVWGPDDQEPICVPALDQNYACGLTELQNKMIRTMVREKGASQQDSTALEQAKRDLVAVVDDLMTSRKQRDRRRAGAIRGLSSNKPEPELHAEAATSKREQPPRDEATRKIKRVPAASTNFDSPPPATYALFRPGLQRGEETTI